MNLRAAAVAASQQGLITRQQAITCGMSVQQIDRLVRTGRWRIVRSGVYAEAAVIETAHAHRERRLLADTAASLRVSSPHVRSHHSAAYVLGLPVLHEPVPTSHFTRPGIVGSHHKRGVMHHRGPYPARAVLRLGGTEVLDAARTALDIARLLGYRQGLVAVDSALRCGTTRSELVAARKEMWCWPGSTVMDDVLASASPDTDSVAETLGRELVTSLGYGVPQVQFGLSANGRTVWCDLRLGRHVIEIDGFVKLVPAAEGGFSTREPEETLWEEKQRQDFVCGFKLGVSRLIWADFWGRARDRARSRLEREYRDTCARFGTDITDLAAYRPRGSRPRPQHPQIPRAA